MAAALVGVVALGGVSAGAAQASLGPPVYKVWNPGPFSDQASCNAISAASYDPPDVYTGACFFSQTNPNYPAVVQPGWYFWKRYLIS